MMNEKSGCRLCPRACGVDRRTGVRGVCGETETLRIARAALHFWEEPCISGTKGSGAVFFSGCALGCVYCQNRPIAGGEIGREISVSRLCEIFFELAAQGANNINLVTPDHFIPAVADAIEQARVRGFSLPFVYNTGSYVTAEALRRLEGLIDIYLPDFKYMDRLRAEEYSHAPDYPQAAKAAVAEMYRQVGEPVFVRAAGETEPLIKRGVIVRHLLLPGGLADAKQIVSYVSDTYGDAVYLSLLRQYTPVNAVKRHPLLGHPVKKRNYDALVDFALRLGVEHAFIQEGSAVNESFIPAFDYEGVEKCRYI